MFGWRRYVTLTSPVPLWGRLTVAYPGAEISTVWEPTETPARENPPPVPVVVLRAPSRRMRALGTPTLDVLSRTVPVSVKLAGAGGLNGQGVGCVVVQNSAFP